MVLAVAKKLHRKTCPHLWSRVVPQNCDGWWCSWGCCKLDEDAISEPSLLFEVSRKEACWYWCCQAVVSGIPWNKAIKLQMSWVVSWRSSNYSKPARKERTGRKSPETERWFEHGGTSTFTHTFDTTGDRVPCRVLGHAKDRIYFLI